MKSLEQLTAEQEKVQKEIRQLENCRKILLNKQADEERRARTRRLIEHGAILLNICICCLSVRTWSDATFTSVDIQTLSPI